MRRSTRCSRWRWSSPMPIGHSSHVAVAACAARFARRGLGAASPPMRPFAAIPAARASSRQRDPHGAAVAQQRHRLQLQRGVGASTQRPARGRSKRRPHDGHVSVPPSSVPPARAARRSPRSSRGRPAASRPRWRRSARAPSPTSWPRSRPATPSSSPTRRRPTGSGARSAAPRRPRRRARAGRAPSPPARARSPAPASLCDAAQPLHEPSSRSRATPSSMPEQLDVAAVGVHVRAHAVQRLAAPASRGSTG